MTAPRPNIRLDPFERAQRDCPPTPEEKPVIGLPWRYVLGWSLVGLLLWTGVIWLISRFW